jgi:hypothetical protein
MELQRNGEDGYITETVELLPTLVDSNRMAHFINVLQGKEEAFVKPAESLALQRFWMRFTSRRAPDRKCDQLKVLGRDKVPLQMTFLH